MFWPALSILSGISSIIFSGISSAILSGVLFGISPGHLSAILPYSAWHAFRLRQYPLRSGWTLRSELAAGARAESGERWEVPERRSSTQSRRPLDLTKPMYSALGKRGASQDYGKRKEQSADERTCALEGLWVWRPAGCSGTWLFCFLLSLLCGCRTASPTRGPRRRKWRSMGLSLYYSIPSDWDSAHVRKHRAELWLSIRRAPGFPKGYPHAWLHRSARLPQAPDVLPKQCPDLATAEVIFATFQTEFRSLENALKRYRVCQAKSRRMADRNIAFRDIAKARSQPVQTLLNKHTACVTEVQGHQVLYAPALLDVDDPVFGPNGLLQLTSHTPGTMITTQEPNLTPGDALTQEQLLGNLPDIFKAFHDLWDPMWNKHRDLPVESWDHVIAKVVLNIPVPTQALELLPITADQWLGEVKRRKRRSAPGPDGVTRDDLLLMPRDLVEILVANINHIEAGGSHWPLSSTVGLISNLEKHDKASAPSDFRPIWRCSEGPKTHEGRKPFCPGALWSRFCDLHHWKAQTRGRSLWPTAGCARSLRRETNFSLMSHHSAMNKQMEALWRTKNVLARCNIGNDHAELCRIRVEARVRTQDERKAWASHQRALEV